MNRKQKVLIIVGPTASGKTALAIEIAKQSNGEVISADSRQVYRGLDIGTGKVTTRETRGIPHHLLDVASPKKIFTARDFVVRGDRAIAEIAERGKLPVIAGGTGFYIDALMRRVALGEASPNPKLRKKLAKKTTAQLFALLKKKDPARAAAMNTPSERNNKVRIIRAIEIALTKISKSQTFQKTELMRKENRHLMLHISYSIDLASYDALWIGINLPFETLEKKIAARLSQRLKRGMIAEARRLHAGGVSYKRMEALGLEYRSLARFLQGKMSRIEMETELNRDIRRYAKHQMTYWKRNPDIYWVKPPQQTIILRRVRNWLKKA